MFSETDEPYSRYSGEEKATRIVNIQEAMEPYLKSTIHYIVSNEFFESARASYYLERSIIEKYRYGNYYCNHQLLQPIHDVIAEVFRYQNRSGVQRPLMEIDYSDYFSHIYVDVDFLEAVDVSYHFVCVQWYEFVCKEMKDGTAEEISCSVCGIYSDITNGGKTAKACMKDPDDATPVMWSIIYLSLADEDLTREWTNEYQDRYSSFESGVKVTLIADYLKGTYGQTIRNISKAAAVSSVMACFVLFIVMLLLIRLVVWRERNDSSLKKALGFTSSDIRMEYLKKTVTYILPGIVLGVFAGIVPGQSLAALLLRSMGAYSFRFIIDPLTVFAAAPAMIAVSAVLAAILSLTEVKRIHAWECLRAGALK